MRTRRVSLYSKQPLYARCGKSVVSLTPDIQAQAGAKITYAEDRYSHFFEEFGPITEAETQDGFSGDIEHSCLKRIDSCSTSDSSLPPLLNLSHFSSDFACDEASVGISKANKVLRGMIIGTRGSGKHSLVEMMYPGCNIERGTKQEFDLATKNIETEDSVERYHFWIKEVQARRSRYESVMNMYYKKCKAFFLVYNVHDKTSFDCLEHEMELLRQMNPRKDLLLVLIGNKQSSGESVEVDVEEARRFKETHNIQMLLEVEISMERFDELKGVIHNLVINCPKV